MPVALLLLLLPQPAPPKKPMETATADPLTKSAPRLTRKKVFAMTILDFGC
jgi:hypothetical protein